MILLSIINSAEKNAQPLQREFKGKTVAIGRVKANDIVLEAPNISKFHSRIVIRDNKVVIIDNQSTNGTFVNGEKITSPRALAVGDVIGVGNFNIKFEELRFEDVEAAGTPSPSGKEKERFDSGVFSLERMDELLKDAPESESIDASIAARAFDDDGDKSATIDDIDAVLGGDGGLIETLDKHLIEDTSSSSEIDSVLGAESHGEKSPDVSGALEVKSASNIDDLLIEPTPAAAMAEEVAPKSEEKELPFMLDDIPTLSNGGDALGDVKIDEGGISSPKSARAKKEEKPKPQVENVVVESAPAEPDAFSDAFHSWLENDGIEEIFILPKGLVRFKGTSPPSPVAYDDISKVNELIDGLANIAGVAVPGDGNWADLTNGWEITYLGRALGGEGAYRMRRSYSSIARQFLEETRDEIECHLMKEGGGLIVVTERESEDTVWQAILPLLPKEKWGIFIGKKEPKKLGQNWLFVDAINQDAVKKVGLMSPSVVALSLECNYLLREIYADMHSYKIGLITLSRVSEVQRALTRLSIDINPNASADNAMRLIVKEITGAALVEKKGRWVYEEL